MNPMWSITSPLSVVDNSTQEYAWTEYRPTTNESATQGNFRVVMNDMENWHRFSEAQLECHFKVYKDVAGTRTNLEADDGVSMPNGFGIWKNIKLLLNKQHLADSPDLADVTTIKNLVNYSQDYAKSVGSNQHFYPMSVSGINEWRNPSPVSSAINVFAWDGVSGNSSGGNYNTHRDYVAGADQNVWNPINHTSPIQEQLGVTFDGTNYDIVKTGKIRENPDYDPNYGKSVDKLDLSQTVTVMLPLKELFPVLGQCFDRVHRASRFELSLDQETDLNKICYVANETNDFTLHSVDITRVSLWVPRVLPSLSTQAMLQKTLASNDTITCKYEHSHLYSETDINNTTTSNRIRLATESAKIVRMFVVFMLKSRKEFPKEYPFQYEDLGVKRLEARINGIQLPGEQYEVDRHLPRVLHELHGLSMKNRDYENGSLIDFKAFNEGPMRIYGIDVSKQSESIYKTKNVSDSEIRYELSGNTSDNYNVLTLMETERELKLEILEGKLSVLQK